MCVLPTSAEGEEMMMMMMMRRVVCGLRPNARRISIAASAKGSLEKEKGDLTSSYFLRLHDHPAGTLVYATFARELRAPKPHANAENAGNKILMNANTNAPAGVAYQETYKSLVSHATAEEEYLILILILRKRLLSTGKDCMALEEVLDHLIISREQMGSSTTQAEARELLKKLEDAGALLILRNQVFLQPEKVARVLSTAMPLLLGEENDTTNQEYDRLKNERKIINEIAHKQVQRILWIAFGAFLAHSTWFLRLSFYDYSWDVMEPITFFVTSGSILVGLLFFFMTKKNPSYHNIWHMLLSFKQHKLLSKRKFDTKKFEELERKHFLPRKINWPNHVGHCGNLGVKVSSEEFTTRIQRRYCSM